MQFGKFACPRDGVVYAANTQCVIKRELTPSILHLAAFQIGPILAVLKNSPLCLHYTAFAFYPVLPRRAWFPPILIHTFQRLSNKNEHQVKTLHFRKCVGLESMWENLACLFSAGSWQHCSNMAQEGFTYGDCLFNHKLFSSVIRQLEKNRKLKCCIWCFFILQIFCVCKCCIKLEVFWPFQAM